MGSLSAWPERLLSNKKRVIEELIQGQECATQLQILFHKHSEDGGRGRISAKELVRKILRSFDETIACVVDAADQVSQNQATSNDNDRRYEDSSESRKRNPYKDRRGCYKRKRAAQTWTVVSATMEDGHAWRKYGQKGILNSIHPRSYFRCTRKYDQGCRATKQVQRMEEDSNMYQTTYIGTHTCINSFKAAPQIIADSESWETFMVNHGDSKTPIKQHHHHHDRHLNPTPTTPSVKQERKEETTTTASDLTDLDSIIWKDIMDGGGFEFSSKPGIGSDYGDVVSNVYPCTEITSRNFEPDFVIKPVDFENEFQFDESECLV